MPSPRTPAQILRQRRAARVVVAGRGRLAAAIAVALAEAGVGQVFPDLSGVVTDQDRVGGPLLAEDVGRPRALAVTEAIERLALGTRTGSVRNGVTLVVQSAWDQPTGLLALKFLRRRQPHLAVSVREGTALVGPFVPARGRPCLNCLLLHRFDISRAALRGIVSDQLGSPQDNPALEAEPLAVATVHATVGHVVAEALTHVDGGVPESCGRELEIFAPGQVRRRTFSPHPRCACTTTPRAQESPTTPP